MRQRWRSLVSPDREEYLESPDADEAFGVWMLGALWALACLGLGYLGGYWVIPGVLMAGLFALWGWRHQEWLWWFPVVLVIATLLEPLSPLPLRSRFGSLVYVDLLALGVGLVAVVRSVVLRLPLLPRTAVDWLVLAMLLLFGVRFLMSPSQPDALVDLKRFVVGVIVFYAATTVASRPRGSRWIWTAFPVASALIGAHALWATMQGPGVLAAHSRLADRVWGTHDGLLSALLVALPVSFGLAFDAGRRLARVLWAVASLVGAVALALHLGVGHGWQGVPTPAGRVPPLDLAWMAIAFATLVWLARLSWQVRRHRSHERSRWLAVALTFVLSGVLQVALAWLYGPVILLLAVAAGLVTGTLRADRRALRSGRSIVPPAKVKKAA